MTKLITMMRVPVCCNGGETPKVMAILKDHNIETEIFFLCYVKNQLGAFLGDNGSINVSTLITLLSLSMNKKSKLFPNLDGSQMHVKNSQEMF